MVELADRAGVTRGTIYAALKREAEGKPLNLDGDTAQGLARVAQSTIEWITTGAGSAPGVSPSSAPAAPRPLRLERKEAIKELVNEDLDPDAVMWAVDRAVLGFVDRSAPGPRLPTGKDVADVARAFIRGGWPTEPTERGPKRTTVPPPAKQRGRHVPRPART